MSNHAGKAAFLSHAQKALAAAVPPEQVALRSALEATSTALACAAQANLLLVSAIAAPEAITPSADESATPAKVRCKDAATGKWIEVDASEIVQPEWMQEALANAPLVQVIPKGAIIVDLSRTFVKATYADREPFPIGAAVVIDVLNGLMWDATSLGEMTFAEATDACAKFRTGGFDDWRMPTRFELESLLDLSRCDPAIDTNLFPDTKSTWYWSSTPAAASPADCAWIVNFGNGSSSWSGHGLRGQVRAVRSVPRASQSSAVGASS